MPWPYARQAWARASESASHCPAADICITDGCKRWPKRFAQEEGSVDGLLCSMQKGGEGNFKSAEIYAAVDLAYKKAGEIRKMLK